MRKHNLLNMLRYCLFPVATLKRGLVVTLASSLLFYIAYLAHAQQQFPEIALTPDGINERYSLDTFATNFTVDVPARIGPLDVAFIPPSPDSPIGRILATEYSTGTVLLFPNDRDRQNAAAPDVLRGPSYGRGNAAGVAALGGAFYLAQQTLGRVVQIDMNGNILAQIASIDHATGIIANPMNGTLLVSQAGSTPNVVYEVNPATGVTTVFIAQPADGLDIDPRSPNPVAPNPVLYLAQGDRVRGFDMVTLGVVFNSGQIGMEGTGPDGVVVGRGPGLNKVFTNTLAGNLIQFDLLANTQKVIATGGSRGDFIRQSCCSLYLSQSDRIMRLTLPNGNAFCCGDSPCFGPSPTPTPTPTPTPVPSPTVIRTPTPTPTPLPSPTPTATSVPIPPTPITPIPRIK